MNLYILGAGDLGREILATIQSSKNKYTNIFFSDDNVEKIGSYLEGRQIVSMQDALDDSLGQYISAIGFNRPKKNVLSRFTEKTSQFINVIHKNAVVFDGVKLGRGVYIGANATVNFNVTLEDHVVVNCNVSVGHDVYVKQRCILSPSCTIGGRAILEEDCFIAPGVVVFPKVTIGNNCEISANAVVFRAVSPEKKVIPIIRNQEMPLNIET